MRGAVVHPCIIHLPSHEHALYKSDKLYDGTRPLKETVLTTQGIRTCALIAHGQKERARSSDLKSFYAGELRFRRTGSHHRRLHSRSARFAPPILCMLVSPRPEPALRRWRVEHGASGRSGIDQILPVPWYLTGGARRCALI